MGETAKLTVTKRQLDSGKIVAVPARTGRLVPCMGEAHSNPFIDNCMDCAPRWGQVEERAPVDLESAFSAGLAVYWSDVPSESYEGIRARVDAGELEVVGICVKARGWSSHGYGVRKAGAK